MDRLANHGVWAEGVTLPGLESTHSNRSSVTLDDHIEFVVSQVQRLATDRDNRTAKVILVAHSTGATVAYGAVDRVPELMGGVFYIDAVPLPSGTALRPDLPASEIQILPPSWEDLLRDELGMETLGKVEQGLWDELAVPHPAGPARQRLELHNTARWNVPAVVVACTMSSADIKALTAAGSPVFAELARTFPNYVDLPGGGHWPMITKPDELADLFVRTVLAGQEALGIGSDGTPSDAMTMGEEARSAGVDH